MAAVWLHRQCSFICFPSTKPQLNLSALLTKSHAHTHLPAWMAASSSCDQNPVIFPAYMCGGIYTDSCPGIYVSEFLRPVVRVSVDRTND